MFPSHDLLSYIVYISLYGDMFVALIRALEISSDWTKIYTSTTSKSLLDLSFLTIGALEL